MIKLGAMIIDYNFHVGNLKVLVEFQINISLWSCVRHDSKLKSHCHIIVSIAKIISDFFKINNWHVKVLQSTEQSIYSHEPPQTVKKINKNSLADSNQDLLLNVTPTDSHKPRNPSRY